MSKARKLIKAIGNVIKNPSLLNHVINDNDLWKSRVEVAYPDNRLLPVVQLFDLIPQSTETVQPFSFLSGGSMPTDLLLLRGLASRFERCSFFEIGTWRGESTANVSSVAFECVTVDLPEAEKRLAGMEEEYINEYARFSKNKSNIKHLQANTAKLDFTSLGKFDLIFIDGDHHYDAIVRDTANVFKHIIKDSSIIVWHDYTFHPEQVRFETLKAILDAIPSEKHSNLYHVNNTMCAVCLPQGVKFENKKVKEFLVKIQPVYSQD